MIVSVNSKDNPQRPSRASSEAIKGDAHRGEEVAIQCHPVPSSAIQSYPVPSSAIQCNHAQSRAITRNHAQSRAIKRNQAHRGEEVDDEGTDLTRVGHVKEDLGHRGEGLRVL